MKAVLVVGKSICMVAAAVYNFRSPAGRLQLFWNVDFFFFFFFSSKRANVRHCCGEQFTLLRSGERGTRQLCRIYSQQLLLMGH